MPFCSKCGAIVTHGSVCPSCHARVIIPAGFSESGGKDATIHDDWHKDLSTGDKLLSSAFKSHQTDVNDAVSLMAGLTESCNLCHQSLTGTVCQYNGKRYHPHCIRCFVCGKVCNESFTIQDENFHCSECTSSAAIQHAASIAKRCNRCNNPITGSAIQVSVGVFHSECFTCQDCNISLDSSSGTAQFTILPSSGRIICKSCFTSQSNTSSTSSSVNTSKQSTPHIPPPPPSRTTTSIVTTSTGLSSVSDVVDTKGRIDAGKEYCASCHQAISTTGVKAMNRWYHTTCLVCHHCKLPLSSQVNDGYVVLNGQPHHERCAQQVNDLASHLDSDQKAVSVPSTSRTCEKCHEALSGKCVTIRGNSYHSSCFTCTSCSAPIPGAYVMVSNQPVCEACARNAMAKDANPQNKGIRVDPITGVVYEGSMKKEWQRPPPNVR